MELKDKITERLMNSTIEIAFEDGEATIISYNNKKWDAYNLLSYPSIDYIGEGEPELSREELSEKVLSDLAPFEHQAKGFADNLDCICFIQIRFQKDTYIYIIYDELMDLYEVFPNGKIIILNVKELLKHYNKDTLLYKLAKKVSKTEESYIDPVEKTISYYDFKKKQKFIASFDETGKVTEFKNCECDL